jgi:translation initiation factor IF-3
MVNEEIGSGLKISGSKILRVVGAEGEQLGLISYASALNGAYEKGLDLVLITQQADPPVCRMMDYGRFRFERDKKDKEAKKKQQVIEIKEIQLSCHIDIGDFNTKGNHARRFLADGNKVKVIVKFRGRQMTHLEIGRELLDKFAEYCAEFGTIDKTPIMEGRTMIMFMAPVKTMPVKAQSAKPAAADTPAEVGTTAQNAEPVQKQ